MQEVVPVVVAFVILGAVVLFLGVPLLIARRLNRVSRALRPPRRRWYWLTRRRDRVSH